MFEALLLFLYLRKRWRLINTCYANSFCTCIVYGILRQFNEFSKAEHQIRYQCSVIEWTAIRAYSTNFAQQKPPNIKFVYGNFQRFWLRWIQWSAKQFELLISECILLHGIYIDQSLSKNKEKKIINRYTCGCDTLLTFQQTKDSARAVIESQRKPSSTICKNVFIVAPLKMSLFKIRISIDHILYQFESQLRSISLFNFE